MSKDRDFNRGKMYMIYNTIDDEIYIGRIQINTNGGKKRKFLYFQSDYKIKNTYSDYISSEGDRDDDELEGFGG